jgi:hypothetical protein
VRPSRTSGLSCQSHVVPLAGVMAGCHGREGRSALMTAMASAELAQERVLQLAGHDLDPGVGDIVPSGRAMAGLRSGSVSARDSRVDPADFRP